MIESRRERKTERERERERETERERARERERERVYVECWLVGPSHQWQRCHRWQGQKWWRTDPT